MESEERKQRRKEMMRMQNNGHNRVWTGLLFLAAGGLLLAKQMGAYIPNWLFSWQMLLIAIGLIISFKSNFSNPGGIVMILVGAAFLINDIIPGAHLQNFIWPGVLIVAGLVFIMRPKPGRFYKGMDKGEGMQYNWNDNNNEIKPAIAAAETETESDAEYVDINAVFGSVNKLVLSKNFKGGEVNTFMGGVEINLLQADIKQTVLLELNNVFGGTKLVLPGNWNVKNEMTAVFGGVEDKRNPNIAAPDVNKIIVLKGACVFGGIEIRNF